MENMDKLKDSKIIKIITPILVIIGIIAFNYYTSESGEEFVQKYTEGYLDINYLNDKKLYKETTFSTEEEMKDIYTSGLEIELEYISEVFEMDELSSSEKEEMLEILDKIYQKSKYEVKEGKEISTGKYEVDVVISPINIIELVDNELIRIASDDSTEEYQEFVSNWNKSMIKTFNSQLSKIGYYEEETVTVNISEIDSYYEFTDEDDLVKINELIIKYDYPTE